MLTCLSFGCQLCLPQNTLLERMKTETDTMCTDQLNRLLIDWAELQHEIRNAVDTEPVALDEAWYADTLETLKSQCEDTDKAALDLRAQFRRFIDIPRYREVVESHATMEPDRGTCDAALVISIATPLNTSAKAKHRAAYQRSRFLINYDQTDSEPGEQTLAETTEPMTYGLDRHPLGTPSGDNPPCKSPCLSSDSFGLHKHEDYIRVLLPQLIVVYRRPDDHERKALNEARMYCIAAIRYYATMGIIEYPVFGLAVHRKVGALIMGWMSSNEVSRFFRRESPV